MTKEQKLEAILDRIASGEISRSDAAAKLEISVRHVNRLMRARGVKRPESPTHQKAAEVEVKRQVKQAAAYAVFNGEMTIEDAAQQAECSERTIYRLLETIHGAPKR